MDAVTIATILIRLGAAAADALIKAGQGSVTIDGKTYDLGQLELKSTGEKLADLGVTDDDIQRALEGE